jgi:hypothetical protein
MLHGEDLVWGLHDVDLHRPVSSHLRRLQRAGVHRAILRFHNEQLCTFHPGHLRPVNGRCAVDVIKAYVQHSSVETFDLTGHGVSILHDQPVCLVSREQRWSESEENNENQVSGVHAGPLDIRLCGLHERCSSKTWTPPPYAETNSRTRIVLQSATSPYYLADASRCDSLGDDSVAHERKHSGGKM